MDYIFIKVEREDDPHRCQGLGRGGQCMYLAYKNEITGNYAKYCIKHGGGKDVTNDREIRNYRFQKYQQRINSFADNNQIKSLREEVGILRMVMEETVNKCDSSSDVLMYSSKISKLVLDIERVVVSCDKLESRLGQSLDKAAVLNLATRMVNIINEHLITIEGGDQIISSIIDEIGDLIKE